MRRFSTSFRRIKIFSSPTPSTMRTTRRICTSTGGAAAAVTSETSGSYPACERRSSSPSRRSAAGGDSSRHSPSEMLRPELNVKADQERELGRLISQLQGVRTTGSLGCWFWRDGRPLGAPRAGAARRTCDSGMTYAFGVPPARDAWFTK
jgi:hypothetical protein